MINILVFLLSVFLGFVIGYYHRDIVERVKLLEERSKEKPVELGTTLGEYGPVNEFSRTNQDGPVGLVETKTPQRIEWEAQESLRREARGE